MVSTSHDQLTVAETGVTHVYTQFGITPTPTFSSNTAFLPVSGFTATGTETEQFWFHPDHLGSSNYITNFVGEVSQHMEYFAFGETFIEEHKNSHNSPYKFNGKELDEESGLYYYGARYYDPRISIWASVDPLVEKTMSAYGYCYQNPINLVDPDGMKPLDWIIHNGLITWDSNVKNQKDAIRYYGAGAKHYAPNAYGIEDKNGDYNLYSDNGQVVKNGTVFKCPDRAVYTNAKKKLIKKQKQQIKQLQP